MTGGYCRTNSKRTGNNQLLDIGGGYPLTSYAGGAGLGQPFGGLIMGSFGMSGVSAVSIGAQSAMSAWFGNTMESGFKIKIIAINNRIISSGIAGIYPSNNGSYIEFVPINSAALGYNATISGNFE
jgi:hypothetical protein